MIVELVTLLSEKMVVSEVLMRYRHTRGCGSGRGDDSGYEGRDGGGL